MRLFVSHRRIRYLLKLIYLIGIIALIIILYNLLTFTPLNHSSKDHNPHDFKQTYKGRDSECEISLHNSIFKGVNKDLEPYTINADKADKISETQFNLEKVKASYEFGHNKLLINAKIGLLDNLNNLMDLKDDVQILFDNLILNTRQISVNLVTKEASSEVQVEMVYKNSQIKADSFTSKDNSNIINFRGNVSTRIKMEDF